MKNEFFPFPEENKWNKLYLNIFYRTSLNGEKKENFNLQKEYENDVFVFRPYSEECSCGFCEKYIKVYGMDHQKNCATRSISEITLLYIYFGAKYGSLDKIIKNEAEAMGFESNFNGNLNELCTCEWMEKVREWEKKNDHSSNCSAVLPNFHHKRLNIKIYSRKNSVEGFIMNKKIPFDVFENVVNEVLQSIR
ncbi:hypothetical protein AAGG74_19210 [Bacillus mexicanus]|uniref:hypothetical protein n=1 Tax=Bacillus mexicanus TaxID=2834415 RepID=UPI003D1D7DF8